jgi:CheY-like chemotaxis protein
MGNGILPMLLLVEDNPDDRWFFLRAMKKAALPVAVTLASDGDEAIGVLSRPPGRLFLILCDIPLPRKSGWEVLGWVRDQAPVRRLPFLLWTSQPDAEGARRALQRGANSYLAKPGRLAEYRGILSLAENYLLASSKY